MDLLVVVRVLPEGSERDVVELEPGGAGVRSESAPLLDGEGQPVGDRSMTA